MIFGNPKDQTAVPADNDEAWVNLIDQANPPSPTASKTINAGVVTYENVDSDWQWIMLKVKGSGAATTGEAITVGEAPA